MQSKPPSTCHFPAKWSLHKSNLETYRKTGQVTHKLLLTPWTKKQKKLIEGSVAFDFGLTCLHPF